MTRSVNAANLLTLLRLVLVPFVILAILDGRHTLALALFAGAALTDILDGAFLALACAGAVPWWLLGIIFGRDFYILAGAATVMLLTPVRQFPPSIWGKMSTLVQAVAAAGWMAGNVGQAKLMLWPCAAFTIWSGIHYTARE